MLLLGVSTAFGQWVWQAEDERYEIKDTTGILNLRVLEEENKMLTIGEDNTLKTYNSETGELENSCQCQPDSNVVYRNISADGKTAVLVSARDTTSKHKPYYKYMYDDFFVKIFDFKKKKRRHEKMKKFQKNNN